jgi:hypothetical protein
MTQIYAVKCARCGIVIGKREEHTYGGRCGEDHTDYGEVIPNEHYGGEYDFDHYCGDCYEDLVLTEECLP